MTLKCNSYAEAEQTTEHFGRPGVHAARLAASQLFTNRTLSSPISLGEIQNHQVSPICRIRRQIGIHLSVPYLALILLLLLQGKKN